MKKISKNSVGFGAIEALLVFSIVGLIGFVGYYVYSQRNNDASNNQSNQDDSMQLSTKEVSYLVIEKWGVKVPQLPSGNVISYKISDYDENQAYFVSSEQKILGGSCGDFDSYRYYIYQAEKGYQPDDETVQARLNDAIESSLVIEANNKNYYILSDMSGGGCTDKLEEAQTMSQQEITANNNLLTSLKGLVAN